MSYIILNSWTQGTVLCVDGRKTGNGSLSRVKPLKIKRTMNIVNSYIQYANETYKLA